VDAVLQGVLSHQIAQVCYCTVKLWEKDIRLEHASCGSMLALHVIKALQPYPPPFDALKGATPQKLARNSENQTRVPLPPVSCDSRMMLRSSSS
jgi:hypothetical protein